MNSENSKKEDGQNGLTKPDPQTENTTDPQEHMEGPISSLMQKAEEGFEEESSKDKSEEEKKD